MKIRGKFIGAVGFSIMAMVVIAGVSLYTRGVTRKSVEEVHASTALVEALVEFENDTRAFLDTGAGLDEVTGTLEAGKQEFGANHPEVFSSLEDTLASVGSAAPLFESNASIHRQVMELTDASIAQSNGYIEQVVGKLIDPELRNEVTDLERQVIIGANTNTSLGYQTKVEFLELQIDLSRGDRMLAFLDTLIENATKDAEMLAGTPFAGMAIVAVEANREIKALVEEYLENGAALQTIRRNALAGVRAQVQGVESQREASLEDTFSYITSSQLLSIALLFVAALISLVVTLLVSGAVSRGLNHLTGVATALADGDVSVDGAGISSKDEMGVLGTSIDRVIESIRSKSKSVQQMAEGDLTNPVELSSDRDLLGRSLNSMQQSFTEILEGVTTAVDQLLNGAEQISQSSQTLAEGATEQAGSLQNITSAASEANDQAERNAETAREASSMADSASGTAKTGNQSMAELLSSMERISKSSEEIGKITKMIDDIAFQINLLALNANVEAARAGKYGKGFAVVADEVRSLAVRSADAVKETNGMVEEALRAIEQGNGVAEKTAGELSEIVNGIEKVSGFLDEIAATGGEQAKVISQITGSLSEIDKVTQANSAGAEESASASEELSGQARQLQGLVGRFTIVEESEQAASYPYARTAPALPAADYRSVEEPAALVGDTKK